VSGAALGPRAGHVDDGRLYPFRGMDELIRQVMRRGSKISEPSWTAARSPPMRADWMTYLWSYRRFALREPHLYALMFGPDWPRSGSVNPADLEAARSTFVSLLRRIPCLRQRRDDGRSTTSPPAGEAVWSGVHGDTTLELPSFSKRSAATGRARTSRSNQECRSASAMTP